MNDEQKSAARELIQAWAGGIFNCLTCSGAGPHQFAMDTEYIFRTKVYDSGIFHLTKEIWLKMINAARDGIRSLKKEQDELRPLAAASDVQLGFSLSGFRPDSVGMPSAVRRRSAKGAGVAGEVTTDTHGRLLGTGHPLNPLQFWCHTVLPGPMEALQP